jgi:hypothetical protein
MTEMDESDDFFVRPWMKRYLPVSVPKRDAIMFILLLLLSWIIAIALIKFFNAETFAPLIFSVCGGGISWHYYDRMVNRRIARKKKHNGESK